MGFAGDEQTGVPVQPPTDLPLRAAVSAVRRLRFAILALVASSAVLFGLGVEPARADVVGTGYGEADLVDLQWATDHLGYDTPAEMQKVGVGVVDRFQQH